MLTHACAPVEKGGLGYRAVVINFRGCKGFHSLQADIFTNQFKLLYQALEFLLQALAYILPVTLTTLEMHWHLFRTNTQKPGS